MILVPLTEHSPFDLVVYKDGRFRRSQVKYRSCNQHGCLQVPFRSIWNDRNGTHRVPIDKDEIDLICVYCPDTDACYYFDPARFSKSATLRVRAAKNNQRAKVNDVTAYRRVPDSQVQIVPTGVSISS